MKKKLTKSQKVFIGTLTPISVILSVLLILCLVTMSMFSPSFLGRVLVHWDSKVSDYKIFPERIIEKSDRSYTYVKNLNSSLDEVKVEYRI